MRLRTTVHVLDPATGRHKVFVAGSTPPDEWAKRINNPDVWEQESEAPVEQPAKEEPAKGPAKEEPEKSDAPPRHGRGSSKEAWAKFASEHGVFVGEDDSRDDIIAALESAGVVEEG